MDASDTGGSLESRLVDPTEPTVAVQLYDRNGTHISTAIIPESYKGMLLILDARPFVMREGSETYHEIPALYCRPVADQRVTH